MKNLNDYVRTIWVGGTVLAALCGFGICVLLGQVICHADRNIMNAAGSMAGISGMIAYVGIAVWILRREE